MDAMLRELDGVRIKSEVELLVRRGVAGTIGR